MYFECFIGYHLGKDGVASICNPPADQAAVQLLILPDKMLDRLMKWFKKGWEENKWIVEATDCSHDLYSCSLGSAL